MRLEAASAISFLLSLLLANCSEVAFGSETLSGKVVVITGASSGFGKGIAEKMAASGAHIVLAARRTALLNALASKCGNDALAVTTDVTDEEEVRRLADEACKKFGHIDVWINDAGVGAFGCFEEIPLKDHSRLIDINLKGVINGSHVAIKTFKAQKFGTLINIGSIESEVPIAYQASYAASKSAVLGLDRALVQEMRLGGEKRIKIVTVMPWAVDTPWWDHAANYSGGAPGLPTMDPPAGVIQAVIKAAIHPHKEIHPGWKAKAAHLSHRLMPGITESGAADVSYKYQMRTKFPVANTSGTLFEPMPSGTEVNGDVRERMKEKALGIKQ